MRVTIFAIGTRGDVEPLLSLGGGLRDAGHDVLIATYAAFEGAVRAAGLAHSSIAGDPRQGVKEMLEAGEVQSLESLRLLRRFGDQLMVQGTHDGLIASRDSDLIIASELGAGLGYSLAEHLHLPLIFAFHSPVTPTRAYPRVHLPGIISRSGTVNLWTHSLANQLIWLFVRRSMNLARQEMLKLPPLSRRDPFREIGRRRLLLYGFSEAVQPRPADWEDSIQVTGYWFLRDRDGWNPPDDIVAFLDAGPPPIYIGFGSMTSPRTWTTTDRLVQAALDAGCRVIVSGGWNEIAPRNGNQSADVMAVGDVPHSWLFPRLAAVIHHGGAGTTAQALRAGVPTLIVPFLPDQVYWGWRVHQLGAGSPPLHPSRIERADLTRMIRELVKSPQMRQRAQELSHHIRADDGVGRAVQLIEANCDQQVALR